MIEEALGPTTCWVGLDPMLSSWYIPQGSQDLPAAFGGGSGGRPEPRNSIGRCQSELEAWVFPIWERNRALFYQRVTICNPFCCK